MQSRSWTHQVRIITTGDKPARLSIYCYRDGNTLRGIGDADTAPGHRVAVRKGSRWECALSWAAPACEVLRYRPAGGEVAPHRVITWLRITPADTAQPDICYPFPCIGSDIPNDGRVTPSALVARGVLYPAHAAPYERLSRLSTEEHQAYFQEAHKAAAFERSGFDRDLGPGREATTPAQEVA